MVARRQVVSLTSYDLFDGQSPTPTASRCRRSMASPGKSDSPAKFVCCCRNGYVKTVDTAASTATTLTSAPHPATLLHRPSSTTNVVYFASCPAKKSADAACSILSVDWTTLERRRISVGEQDGKIVGLSSTERDLLTCHSNASGTVALWKDAKYSDKPERSVVCSVGEGVECFAHHAIDAHIFATGGKENDVAVYDLVSGANLFRGKNVKPNWVQLRQPIWIRQLLFDPSHSSRVLCTTNHHQIRLYDRRANGGKQRRPVIDFQWSDNPITALDLNPANLQQLVVGNSAGKMDMVDLRMKKTAFAYRGIAGTIKQITIADGVIATASLDRFVRFHDVDSRKLLNEIYVKSEANGIIAMPPDSLPSGGVDCAVPNAGEQRLESKKRSLAVQDASGDDDAPSKRSK